MKNTNTESFIVTDAIVRDYATELLDLAQSNGSFPRIIAIYADGSIDSGFYESSLSQGAWHQTDDLIGIVEFKEPPMLDPGDGLPSLEEVVDIWSDDIHDAIDCAVAEFEENE